MAGVGRGAAVCFGLGGSGSAVGAEGSGGVSLGLAGVLVGFRVVFGDSVLDADDWDDGLSLDDVSDGDEPEPEPDSDERSPFAAVVGVAVAISSYDRGTRRVRSV